MYTVVEGQTRAETKEKAVEVTTIIQILFPQVIELTKALQLLELLACSKTSQLASHVPSRSVPGPWQWIQAAVTV